MAFAAEPAFSKFAPRGDGIVTVKGEAQALLQKAQRYLRSAELLRKDGDFASAASRLYYSMFYCAEALLLTKGLSFSTHGSVIAAFGQHFVKTGLLRSELHQWLQNAFDKRQVGDYEALPALNETDIIALHQQAEEFVSEAETYLQKEGWLP